ncbi:MAG: response regulator transcription factor [Candidatus Sulfotelmatobacter sp.]
MSLYAQMRKEMFNARIRCVLVHDHVLLRQGLRRLLEDKPDLEVVSEAGNAAECLRKVFEFRPDVVIADADAFGLAASEVELLIARESASTRLVLLSTQERPATLEEPHTVTEYSVARHTSVEDLVKMVREAHLRAGTDSTLSSTEKLERSVEPPSSENDPLTVREREVLKLLAEGKTVRAAATDLGLSSKTVDAHKFNLMRKLGIHNKAELVMWAIQKRVVKIPA